ncbi:MAG: hypothetical protein CO064_06430 [Anaerolineae bacterium CG_4_9_14_0_8_um_filter_58_9]|nr:MAG: hypothetical protein CO064_06430 [Anaerolineae bacterium CG_4_9_14_0_8_um_filter_58_9]
MAYGRWAIGINQRPSAISHQPSAIRHLPFDREERSNMPEPRMQHAIQTTNLADILEQLDRMETRLEVAA